VSEPACLHVLQMCMCMCVHYQCSAVPDFSFLFCSQANQQLLSIRKDELVSE
jgi:hypothetical protein